MVRIEELADRNDIVITCDLIDADHLVVISEFLADLVSSIGTKTATRSRRGQILTKYSHYWH
jgi:hypothetical protein